MEKHDAHDQTSQPAPKEAPAADPSMVEQQATNAGKALTSAINKVPVEMKIVLVGAILAFIGCFLPWWSQTATGPYGTTYSINAFTDSTFLLGMLVFLGAIFSIVVAVFEFLGKKPKFLKIPHSLVQLIIGGEMTLLMFIAFSIFTSPRFTTAADSVSARVTAGVSWGIFVPLLGSVMILVGGWLEYKGGDLLAGLGKKGAAPKETPAHS